MSWRVILFWLLPTSLALADLPHRVNAVSLSFRDDGSLVVQERNLNNLPTTTYTRGKDLSGGLAGAGGIGGLLSMTLNTGPGPAGSNSMFYHSDGNGNVTMLINGYQAIVAKYLYDAFGNTLSAAGSLAQQNLYRFSSKEAHPNSGLVYYLYRFYDPHLQRWANRDPIAERGGANLYAFTGNGPTDAVDANGQSCRNFWNNTAKKLLHFMWGDHHTTADPNSYIAQRTALLGPTEDTLTPSLQYAFTEAGDLASTLAVGEAVGGALGVVADGTGLFASTATDVGETALTDVADAATTSADTTGSLADTAATTDTAADSASAAGGSTSDVTDAGAGTTEETSVNILPSSGKTFAVDAKGNVFPLEPGETLTGSPNGNWIQVRDANGNPTGMRLDGGHNPLSHPDPAAQVPHAHVPGVTNPNGTPWLPVNQ